MNTIKSGKLFCQKYNEVNNSNYTPKEIFCKVITPLLFYGDKFLVNWTNSKFFAYKKLLNNGKVKLTQDTFDKVVFDFCNEVENDTYNVMTTMNVFGGCANPKLDKEGQTTMFSYCDNLFFDYDERYCSFIGSIFAFQCNGWYILVNDKETIWDTYLGIIEYRRELERNTNLKGNQVYAWNTAYLFIKQNNEDISYIIDEFYNDKKLELDGKINLFNFLFLINKLNRYIDKFELFNCGQYNKSCGTILIDIEYVNTAYKLYKQLYSDIGYDFRYADFNKIFGSKRNMLYKAMEIGSIHKGFFNPLTDISDIKKNKYKQKYIELIMSDEEKDLAIKFVKSLKELIKKSRNNINVEEIFNERKKYKLVDKLLNLDKCNEFQEVIDYVYSNKKYNDSENLLNFLTFCKYKFIY